MRVDSGLVRRMDDDPPVVLTIGNFDGVHLGHRALLDQVHAVAARRGGSTAVLTFEPHPRCVLDPERCPPILTAVADKAELLAAGGVDRLTILPFTEEVSRWSPEQFCDLLLEAFDLHALVVGHDFALGHRRQGDIEFLRHYGARHGIDVVTVAEVSTEDGGVSSSRIRSLIGSGEMVRAAAMLGRPHSVEASAEWMTSADSPGRPQALLSIAPAACVPPAGDYALWLRAGGEWHGGAGHLGRRPGPDGDVTTMLVSVLDGDRTAPDTVVRVALVAPLDGGDRQGVEAVSDPVSAVTAEARLVLERGLPPDGPRRSTGAAPAT